MEMALFWPLVYLKYKEKEEDREEMRLYEVINKEWRMENGERTILRKIRPHKSG